MSEADLRRQRDRRPAPPPDVAGKLTLTEAKQKLADRTQTLLTADPRTLQKLVIEIQTLRVTVLLLTEAETGEADPNTYRELSMLQRMINGQGDSDDPNAAASAAEVLAEGDAAARLEKRGISRESIPQMVRILTALGGRAAAPTPAEDDDEGDEPDMVN